jgi:hypothetical protein
MAPVKINRKISFAAFCADVLGESISPAWVTVFKAFQGEPLTNAELETWRALSGQEDYKPQERGELWCVKGRRAAGTKTTAKFVCYLIHAHGHEYRKFAAKSDRLHALIVLQTRDIAKEVMAYFNGFYVFVQGTPWNEHSDRVSGRDRCMARGGHGPRRRSLQIASARDDSIQELEADRPRQSMGTGWITVRLLAAPV